MATDYTSLLFGPKKPAVSVEVEMESGEYEPTDAEVVAAAEVISASKSGDAKRLACAMHHAYMVIKGCCDAEMDGMEGMSDD